MQERYLGDDKDFLKYRLLRHLENVTNFLIGLNWYLVRPEDVDPPDNKDGEMRTHLTGNDSNKWQSWDKHLYDSIEFFKFDQNRFLKKFYNSKILTPNTVYFDHHVPLTRAERTQWHQNALLKFKDCDLVFLDPDNGFEVDSARGKELAKYAFYKEALDYYRSGKALISVQFARQVSPIKRANDVRSKIGLEVNVIKHLPVIRGRVVPTILFISLAPTEYYEQLKEAIKTFIEASPSMKGKNQYRVELIE